MVFQLQRGLFTTDFSDHYAVLGVPIGADAKEIRKSYLKIARRLHPDSTAIVSETDKQLAAQLLSKLVNPAWEILSNDQQRQEYTLLLKLKGQAAARNPSAIAHLGGLAQKVMETKPLAHAYRSAAQEISGQQYELLDQALELIEQLSEVNLIYLARSEGDFQPSTVAPAPSAPPTEHPTPSATPAAAAPATPSAATPTASTARHSLAEPYYNRAEIAFRRQNYAQAILELRDAIKLDAKESRYQSLLGMVYLEQKQGTMARIHFDKALELNPQDPLALAGKQKLQGSAQTLTAKATTKPADPMAKQSGGLFGGLFGNKKK
ncbi:MAG: DnaJ domain-containing protein [Synechococcales bacterium]|nr:DnaJ domain-containing protein [Synechococcales bacterium]